MQAHTHILSQACLPDYSQVLASLPSSSGRLELHQGKPQLSQLRPNGQAQAGSTHSSIRLPHTCFQEHTGPGRSHQPQPAPGHLEHESLGSQAHVACLQRKVQGGESAMGF